MPFSSQLMRYRTGFTVNRDTGLPVSASIITCFAVVWGLIPGFRAKNHSSLGHRIRLLPALYDGPTFPFVDCQLLSERMNMGLSGILSVEVHTFPDVCIDFSRFFP